MHMWKCRLLSACFLWQKKSSGWNLTPQHRCGYLRHLNGLLWPWLPKSNHVISSGYWFFYVRFIETAQNCSWDIVVTRPSEGQPKNIMPPFDNNVRWRRDKNHKYFHTQKPQNTYNVEKHANLFVQCIDCFLLITVQQSIQHHRQYSYN